MPRRSVVAPPSLAALLLLLAAAPAAAQHDPAQHATHVAAATSGAASAVPTMPGQAAFGAIAEVVRLLEADPATDWARVDLERLRQHLVDMDELTLRTSVRRREVPGGLEMEVTGTGRAAEAARSMTASHARQLAAHGLRATSTPIAGGARFTVVAADAADARLVAKVRGLGFIGLMALGDHHAAHHLAIARGGAVAGHDH